jgi:hypothetical protein
MKAGSLRPCFFTARLTNYLESIVMASESLIAPVFRAEIASSGASSCPKKIDKGPNFRLIFLI